MTRPAGGVAAETLGAVLAVGVRESSKSRLMIPGMKACTGGCLYWPTEKAVVRYRSDDGQLYEVLGCCAAGGRKTEELEV